MTVIKKTISITEPIEEEIHANQIVILNNLTSGKKRISFNVESKIIDNVGDVDLSIKTKRPNVNRNLDDTLTDSVTFTNELGVEVTITGATLALTLEKFFIKYYDEDEAAREIIETEKE